MKKKLNAVYGTFIVKIVINYYIYIWSVKHLDCKFTLSVNSLPCWQRLFTITPPSNVCLG